MQLVSFKGAVSHVGPVEKVGKEKNFPVQKIVIQRPAGPWQIELAGDERIELANGVEVGDLVEVDCDLQCREWQKDANSQVKYFFSLKLIGLKKAESLMAADGTKTNMFGGKGPAGADITKMDDVPF